MQVYIYVIQSKTRTYMYLIKWILQILEESFLFTVP